MSTSSSARRRMTATAAADAYGGALSRALLREMGADRHAVAREIAADRWRSHGHQTVAVHTQALGEQALAWRAIWEVGRRIAALDGVSALRQAGLTGQEPVVHISVPHGARVRDVSGVTVHRVRRLSDEVVGAGIPRVRTHIATLRAASWARADRQAALVVAMSAQQRLTSSAQLQAAASTMTAKGRRLLVRQIVIDVTDGAQSLGELDFTRLCRVRGLPPPEHQLVRHGPRGRIYLDVGWPSFGVTVEIDGAQHRTGLEVVSDNLRQNGVVLTGQRVLRVPVIGLRLAPSPFMDQVEAALVAGGWRAPAPVRTRTAG